MNLKKENEKFKNGAKCEKRGKGKTRNIERMKHQKK